MITDARVHEIMTTPGIRLSMEELDELSEYLEEHQTSEVKAANAQRKYNQRYYRRHRDKILKKRREQYQAEKRRLGELR